MAKDAVMDNRQQVLAEAIRVINQSYVGMLTSVGADGVPHARWMGSTTLADGLHRIYTLCGKHSRKVRQIQENPQVCWVYTTQAFGDVVTLYGHAQVITAPIVTQQVWDRLVETAQVYINGALAAEENLEFVTIETHVTKLEFYSPKRKLYRPQVVEIA